MHAMSQKVQENEDKMSGKINVKLEYGEIIALEALLEAHSERSWQLDVMYNRSRSSAYESLKQARKDEDNIRKSVYYDPQV